MALSSELVSQFTKVTNDSNRDTGKTALRGTITKYDEALFVQLDGSNEITPISRTVEVAEGDRVEVAIENHAATVTGNLTDPSVGIVRAGNLESRITQTASEIRLEVADEVERLNTRISLTENEIKLEVNNEIQQLNSTITQTASEINMTISNNQEEFSTFKQTIEGFSFMGTGGTVKISGGDINLTGSITWSDFGSELTTDIESIEDTANSASDAASNAATAAEDASETANDARSLARSIANGKYLDGTFIDGKSIKSPSIEGNEIKVHGTFQTIGHDGVNQLITGYMGAAVGEDYYGNETIGVALTNEWDDSTGEIGNSYAIVTNSGVRLQFNKNSVLVSTRGVSITTDEASGCKIYHNDVPVTFGGGSGDVKAVWG